jgi:peptidoglycan/LPS O-acetylase OafA/YrhL
VQRLNHLYFHEQRARRILPALSLTLALSVLDAIAILTPEYLRSFGKVLVGVPTVTSNMVIIFDAEEFF